MTTETGSQAREFVGTRRLRSLEGTAASLVFALVPLVWWLGHALRPSLDLPPRDGFGGPWVWGAFGAAALLYYALIAVRRSVVRLDGTRLVAGGIEFLRDGLTVELCRWIDTTNGYGTTEGTALSLKQGRHHLVVGCKGASPGDDVPTSADVRVVLSASDLRDLYAALRPSPVESGADRALTVHVASAPSRARRLSWTIAPFGAAVALSSLLGNSHLDRHCSLPASSSATPNGTRSIGRCACERGAPFSVTGVTRAAL